MGRWRLAALLTTVLLSLGHPALAHGTFVDARPLPGVEVGGVVEEVAFLFPEPVEQDSAVIAVTGPDGLSVPVHGRPETPVPAAIRVTIEALTLPGEYRVDHAVTSRDGFVFQGSFTFVYDPAAPSLELLPYGREPLPWPWLVGAFVALVGISVLLRRRGVRRRDGD